MRDGQGSVAQERVLFELWQDACQLDRFLAHSRLTREEYLATPLSRVTPLRILGIIGVHASQADDATRESLPGIGLSRFVPYASLTRDGVSYQADAATLERLWSEGLESVPSLREALANDPRVVRQRTLWDHLSQRSPADWPQPPTTTVPDLGSPLDRVRAEAPSLLGKVRSALGLWSLAGPSPAVFALETDGHLTDAQALGIIEGIRNALGSTEAELIPQEAIHPLLWDEVVAREQLIWRRDGIGEVTLVPSAMTSGHHHHDR
jgi:hypothetical protein